MSEHERHSNELLNQRSDFKAVLMMSAPMVVTTCSPMIMRVADFAFVSKLGTEAQAAIIPTQMLMWCYMAMCMGLVTSVNTFAAQALGRNRLRDCSAYAWQSVHVSTLLGIIGLCLYPAVPTLFGWIGHAPEVQRLEILYAQVSVWAILPTVAAQALGAFFNGVHRPGLTMVAAVETNALNIFLNYALIFGAFGFPEMGFAGAAMGTVLAAYYQVARLLFSFCRPRFHREFDSRHTWRPNWAKLRGLWKVGAPQGVHWLSDVMVWALFSMVLIGRFGTVELAASNVAWQYVRISFLPMIGVGQALTSLVGRAIGEHDPERAVRQTRIAIGLTLVYIALLSTVYILGRRPLIAFFAEDEAVIAVGMQLMICLAIFQISDVFGTTYYHALRGAGDTTWPMITLVVSHWTVVIGGGYTIAVLKPELGSLGPWIMATILIIGVGALMWWRWHSRAWMKIDIFRDERAEESVLPAAAAAVAGEAAEIAVSSKQGAPN